MCVLNVAAGGEEEAIVFNARIDIGHRIAVGGEVSAGDWHPVALEIVEPAIAKRRSAGVRGRDAVAAKVLDERIAALE